MITYKKFLESRSSSILKKIFEHLNDVNYILSVYSDEYDNMVCKIENRIFLYLDRELIDIIINNDDNGIRLNDKSSDHGNSGSSFDTKKLLDTLNILEYNESGLSYYLRFEVYEISVIDKIKEELMSRYPFLIITYHKGVETEKLRIRIFLDLNKL